MSSIEDSGNPVKRVKKGGAGTAVFMSHCAVQIRKFAPQWDMIEGIDKAVWLIGRTTFERVRPFFVAPLF